MVGLAIFIIWVSRIISNEAYESNKRVCESTNINETIPIYSLNLMNVNKGEIRGSFSYTYGNFKEDTYYVFYQILEDEGKNLIRIPSESSIIYNDENDAPYILKNTTGSYKFKNCIEKYEYKIHIPQNAIQQEYNGELSNLN